MATSNITKSSASKVSVKSSTAKGARSKTSQKPASAGKAAKSAGRAKAAHEEKKTALIRSSSTRTTTRSTASDSKSSSGKTAARVSKTAAESARTPNVKIDAKAPGSVKISSAAAKILASVEQTVSPKAKASAKPAGRATTADKIAPKTISKAASGQGESVVHEGKAAPKAVRSSQANASDASAAPQSEDSSSPQAKNEIASHDQKGFRSDLSKIQPLQATAVAQVHPAPARVEPAPLSQETLQASQMQPLIKNEDAPVMQKAQNISVPAGKASSPVARAPIGVKPSAAKPAPRPTGQKLGFKTNEFVVYPAHGVGQIIAIEIQEVAGFKLELFVISFIKDKMILKVPTPKVVSVGMRKLSESAIITKALDTLMGRARIKRTMWSRRAQEYEAKINSGDIVAIAEVVRDLYRSDAQPEQSYSERQLYEAAVDRICRELAVVNKITDHEALKLIETQLQKSPRRAAKGEADSEGDIEEAA